MGAAGGGMCGEGRRSLPTALSEKQSGKSRDVRPEFGKLMKALLPGDTVVVTKLDRLVRSSRDLYNGWPLLRLPVAWGKLVRHHDRCRQADVDQHGRHC